jgi:predicted Zn-dependent protease
MRLRGLITALLGLLLLPTAPARAQLPPLVSEAQEAQQGAAAHPQVVRQYGGIYDDPELGAYVALVGARLLAAAGEQGKEYTFSILDSDIPNAFALPGGYAYVTRGMLTLINTEAELAGVMGHEIGHVIARHSAQRQTGNLIAGLLAGAIGALTRSADIAQFAGILGQGALAQYSQSQEYEADAPACASCAPAAGTRWAPPTC